MSTNYYVKQTTCDHCGHTPDNLHIGKNLKGWEFIFQATKKLRTFEDWCDFLENETIIDEYDQEVSFVEFIKILQESVWAKNYHNYSVDQGYSNTFNDPAGWSFIESEFS